MLLTEDDRVIFLSPSDRQPSKFSLPTTFRSSQQHTRNRITQAVAACAQCHSFVANDHASAPSLARVYGADIASSSFGNYSSGSPTAWRPDWTREKSSPSWMIPQAFAPGTTDADPGMDDTRTREEIVNMLDEMRRSF